MLKVYPVHVLMRLERQAMAIKEQVRSMAAAISATREIKDGKYTITEQDSDAALTQLIDQPEKMKKIVGLD